MLVRKYIYVVLVLLLASCQQFEFDPNQSVSAFSADRLNYMNIERIIQEPPTEEMVIAITGDSHLDYDNLSRFVKQVNTDATIDFIVHTGDLTDHGLLREFEWATERLQKLNKPFVVTLGNHDVLSLGEDSYKHMYGNENFSFVKDSIKVVVFNSNGREYGFKGNVPDMAWLHKELFTTNDFKNVIMVSHVPYWDRDFDLGLKPDYMRLLREVNAKTPILAHINGHLHMQVVETRTDNGLLQILPGSIGSRVYVKLIINQNGVRYEKVTF